MERDIFKKSHGHLQQSTEMKFKFIEKNRSLFPVKKMCLVLEISRAVITVGERHRYHLER